MIQPPDQSRGAPLRQALFDAFEQLQAAHASYKGALEIAIDTDQSSDGMFAIKQQGRVYANAVKQYSDAVMAWLTAVEANRADALELLRRTRTSGA